MSSYFDVQEIIDKSPHTRLFYIMGQGGVGKSYSIKKYMINRYLKDRKKFIYVRRWTTEICNSEMSTVFDDVTDNIDWPDEYADFYMHILVKSGFFWLVGESEDGTLTWIDKIGKITCVSKAEQFKGGTYGEYETIFFDEVITERGYIHGDKEPEMFAKIVGTVGRGGEAAKNVEGFKVFFAGNPDSSIEACPYLYPLKLDYERIQSNTIYYYDSKSGNKTIANNIAFVKIANYNGKSFLNEFTTNLFGTSEEEMRATGSVKTNKYIHIDDLSDFAPAFELVVETPVVTEREFHKRIYVYYGVMYGEAVCVCLQHHKYDVVSLYCRYDKTDFRSRSTRQTYRVNIPPDLTELKSLMAQVHANQLILSDEDGTATLYETIVKNSTP